jgi:Ran GTPase-activating protein (RanGAP) involved in mRNA processing and transport
LSEALQSNTECSLTHLDLRNNSIGNEGAIALSRSLSSNASLAVLDLRWNQVEDSGALSFQQALSQRSPKLTLLASGNLLSEAASRQIADWGSARRSAPLSEQKESAPAPSEMESKGAAINSAFLYQNELLQKEIVTLRQQCISLQRVFSDLQVIAIDSFYKYSDKIERLL